MSRNSHPLIVKYDSYIWAAADSYSLAGDLETFIFIPAWILLV